MTSQSISFQNKWLWSFSFGLDWSFLEIPQNPLFDFDSTAQNEKAESAENFRFSISSRDFCQT